ncbi:MAG: Rieske 2Fe-2S domain-containing protein [Desulfobacterales bacterium]
MKLLKRIFGICETRPPSDDACWEYADQQIRLHLDRVPELDRPGSAIRLEGKGLPIRTLVVHGQDGALHAFANRCSHMGRRIDPQAGTDRIQCCSVGQSVFNYHGEPLGGSAQKPLQVFRIDHSDRLLKISLV